MYMYISLHFSAISLLKPIQSPVATQLPERSAGSSGLGNASNNFYFIYIYIFCSFFEVDHKHKVMGRLVGSGHTVLCAC